MPDQIPERLQILNKARDFGAAGGDLQSQFGRMCQEILVMQESINQLSSLVTEQGIRLQARDMSDLAGR